MRFIILLLLVASCAPIYAPTTRNAPLFRGAGEFQASGYLTTGLDFQAASEVYFDYVPLQFAIRDSAKGWR
ncbi:MAG: hypothetical protein JJE09_15880 [Bacteroidia bacterium]|nr:hypothetical protein [Bacteroidia bacterium]